MVAVIGDVHGCYHTLKKLQQKVIRKFPGVEVFCTGDLVDRGNFSCETIDYCRENNIKVCLGNHDLMFLSYFRDPSSIMARSWIYNGHISTINSYKNNPMSLEEHLDYIESLKLFYNTEDCLITHAGISTHYQKFIREYKLDGHHDDFIERLFRKDLDKEFSILWTRKDFLKIGKLQVVGHNRKFDIQYDTDKNIIFIDTGCAYGNKLTAIIVDNGIVVENLSIPVIAEDIMS